MLRRIATLLALLTGLNALAPQALATPPGAEQVGSAVAPVDQSTPVVTVPIAAGHTAAEAATAPFDRTQASEPRICVRLKADRARE